MSTTENAVILIPCYEPDEKLIALLEKLTKYSYSAIVIVDDGSGEKYKNLFDRCRAFDLCDVIGYDVNRGKGGALKFGFSHIFEKYPSCDCIVTADCDGQHSPEDIFAVAQAVIAEPDKLILGSRDCLEENVPKRSMLGNRITRSIFKLVSGIAVRDTQTGLRGLSRKTGEAFMNTHGNRYEYEMNMLVEAHPKGIEIKEIPIKTIYIDGNKTTHFNAVTDSARVYRIFLLHFLKFIFSSLFSTGVDWLVYAGMLYFVFKHSIPDDASWLEIIGDTALIVSFTLARVASSLTNYYINKKIVFHDTRKTKKTVVKYFILVIFIAICTLLLESLFMLWFGIPELIAHMIAMTLMFIVSYFIQRKLVF